MREKLDIIFSRYVRLRDTDALGNGKCFTCGQPVTYHTSECGHFRHRRHDCTRWHPQNAHIQCVECNHGDDMAKYIVAMLDKYPDEEVHELVRLSNQSCKFTKHEIEEMYNQFRQMAKDLLNDKMFIVKL